MTKQTIWLGFLYTNAHPYGRLHRSGEQIGASVPVAGASGADDGGNFGLVGQQTQKRLKQGIV